MRSKSIALLGVLLLLLSACAGLPRSGEVQVQERLRQVDGDVTLHPVGPKKGATPQEIVESFTRAAAAGLYDDFAVAREYLMPEAAAKWNPLMQVSIYADSRTPATSQTDTGSFKTSVAALGSINAEGMYANAPQDALITNEYSLVRNSDKEWRISVLTDGIVIPQAIFSSFYAEAALYFLNQDNSALVADVRWYPRKRLSSQLARGLVAGPSKWLAGAVKSAIPASADVESVEVQVDPAVAKINLSSDIVSLPDSALALINAQFEKTFAAAGLAPKIKIFAKGGPVRDTAKLDLPVYPLATSPLTALADGIPVQITKNQQLPLFNNAAIAGLGLTDLAAGYSDNVQYGAALGKERSRLYLLNYADARWQQIYSGRELAGPSMDRYAWIWVGEKRSDGALTAISMESGADIHLDIPSLKGKDVQAIAVSREGNRIVVACRKETKQELLVAAIVRDEHGKPVKLGEPLQIGQRLENISDIAWISESKLAVLAKESEKDENSLSALQIGGPMKKINGITNPQALTAGRGKDSIVLLGADSKLYEYSAGVWKVIAEKVSAPALAG
ncbi:LpqB family beta-propeller domain-containing protein [Arcanobacterium urinimassiliense]|uniref:LpqB family beta-propeller domain-containing protein n=1 Tax=Arcanobacterium urinimassiliense TaxID=1871014 RepID=UPI00093F4930|nr:LpqB family beta-propeller domain-containing protein [Arcanobacterium urinimassiliense]MBS6274652.1 GerMN domain-containing protein [Actinomycetaceae bacterium]